MFYENQPQAMKDDYKKILSRIGSLSYLFSESECPYLSYRAHENAFCRYFRAENLARADCSADAKKDRIGVGLKTWMGQDDQKVAEFGRLRGTFAGRTGLDLVRAISEYRNERIRVTKNLHGIDTMIYHIVKRVPGAMQIFEHAFDYIDIDHLRLIPDRGNDNNTYFTDGNHVYHFSTSKNTLYMLFEDMELLDTFDVEIMDDPFTFLMQLVYGNQPAAADQGEEDEAAVNMEAFLTPAPRLPQLCLRLYSENSRRGRFVAEKSGLNQWNAGGRARHPDELYIPYPKEDRDRIPNFFPGRETVFNLTLPDGTVIPAKVCQEADPAAPEVGKAIMSNPNKVLGEWLLRKVFELPEGTLVTYDMLARFGVDSVIFTKHGELAYSVDFAELGTYDRFYGGALQDDE